MKKRQFKAHLIKYRQSDMREPIWLWVNSSSGETISPLFDTREDAEKWCSDIIKVTNEAYDLITRTSSGKFYTVKGKVDFDTVISSEKAGECPFTTHLEDDILSVEVLATTPEDAKERVKEYFEILEWID